MQTPLGFLLSQVCWYMYHISVVFLVIHLTISDIYLIKPVIAYFGNILNDISIHLSRQLIVT